MRGLAARASSIPEVIGDAPWLEHEYVRGWGVFGLPFDSGHVLALRVFPQNSFAAYRAVWHRDPSRRWSIFVDAPRLDIACPRYFGPACAHVGHAKIELNWTGSRALDVTVDAPALHWTLAVTRAPVLGLINPISAALPTASWRPPVLLRARERMARALGLGRLNLSGTMPSGHTGVLMPQRMYFIDRAQATLDEVDLGRPIRLASNPMIGDVALPARGLLAFGQAMWRVRDLDEFDRVRADVTRREETSPAGSA